MIACYILYSSSLDKFYTGITQESVKNRLEKHNNSGYGNHYTSHAKDWIIFLVISCSSVAQSMKIEKHIKKMKSKKYICNLKSYPEIIEKLKIKYF
ncbi:MAG TPA: GIY-YIG nuclease family protein [Hanamia sp.]